MRKEEERIRGENGERKKIREGRRFQEWKVNGMKKKLAGNESCE